MKIALFRIDDRLIHGQVVTVWSKVTKCQRIIVCSDEVANDELRKTLLTQVAPPGVKAHVVSIDKAARVINNPKYENDVVILLFTCPKDIYRLLNTGIDVKSVNIGGISYKEGNIQLTNAIFVNQEDISYFKKLNDLKVELEIRKVASDQKSFVMPLIEKL